MSINEPAKKHKVVRMIDPTILKEKALRDFYSESLDFYSKNLVASFDRMVEKELEDGGRLTSILDP